MNEWPHYVWILIIVGGWLVCGVLGGLIMYNEMRFTYRRLNTKHDIIEDRTYALIMMLLGPVTLLISLPLLLHGQGVVPQEWRRKGGTDE